MTVPARRFGLGTYRMRHDDPSHVEALTAAIRAGWPVVDTASNYGDGSAELLVGRTLAGLGDEARARRVSVWTKAGYVSATLERQLAGERRHVQRLDEQSGYSLHPDVLEASLRSSLARLQGHPVDVLFLHNPEHALQADAEGFDRRWVAAAQWCEDQVARGRIGRWGVSSSAWSEASPGAIASVVGAPSLRLDHLLDLVRTAAAATSLEVIQTPLNLVEQGAATGPAPTVLEIAHAAGIRVAAHRSLSAVIDGRRTILADPAPPEAVEQLYRSGRQLLADLFAVVDRQLTDGGHAERAIDFPVLRFLRDTWRDVPDVDLYDHIYARRLHPFLDTLSGGADPEAILLADQLREHARSLARGVVGPDRRSVRDRLVASCAVAADDRRPLDLVAAGHPLVLGADLVLIGARRAHQVARLTSSALGRPPAYQVAAPTAQIPGRRRPGICADDQLQPLVEPQPSQT